MTIPDFSRWTSARLQFMFKEYTESLDSLRHFGNPTETKLYEDWVRAIKEELDKREARRSNVR